MSIIENRDENIKKLCKSFEKEFGYTPSTSSYNELKEKICVIMKIRESQNTLDNEKLKIQTRISEIKNKEYIANISLAISVLSVATSFFFSSNCLLFIFIGFVLGLAAVGSSFFALKYHKLLTRDLLYSEFKLKCIEEVEQKKIKHINVVKICKR